MKPSPIERRYKTAFEPTNVFYEICVFKEDKTSN
jgi:hypothetical protein